MLLNYLYKNFLEECVFVQTCGISGNELNALIADRVFPTASYVYEGGGRSMSFVSDFAEDQIYRFHLKGYLAWFETLSRLGLDTEQRARSHFFHRYDEAKRSFLSSALGQQLVAVAPQIPAKFNTDHADSTWGHFLNGVYGVCTRDGQPESVFLKQMGVMFIEQMIAGGPDSLSSPQIELLEDTVSLLDTVESDFAPHEVPGVSRQRYIIDVRANYFLA